MKKLLLLILLILVGFKKADASTRVNKEVTLVTGSTSVEIQKLLDLNKNNEYNLTIYIPEGTYILNSELRIYSYTTIIADKNAKLMKNHLKGAMIANDMRKDSGGYTTTTDVTISGGVWDSSMIVEKNKGTESFRFIHAMNITIKDATVCNVPNKSHLITFAGVKNGIIQNCTLYGYGGSTLKEAIQLDIVHDNVMVPSMQSAYITYDDLPCYNIRIEDNEIYNYPRAIGSHMSVQGVFHKKIMIIRNDIHDLAEAAIKLYNYVDVKVQENTISNACVGVLVYTYLCGSSTHYLPPLDTTQTESIPTDYQIDISKNTIKNIAQYITSSGPTYGDAIRAIGSGLRTLKGVTIKSNYCENIARYGIYMQYSPQCYIGGNTVRVTARYAILLSDSSNSKLRYNKLSKAGTAKSNYGGIGISSSSNLLLYKNTIYSLAKNGIYLGSTVRNSIVEQNIIFGMPKNMAIVVDTSKGNVRKGNILK